MRIIEKSKAPSKIAAFTGHRDLPWGYDERHPLCVEAKARMSNAIIQEISNEKNTFLCGLALGADTFFAEEVIRLRDEGLRIYLVAAIPSEHQANRWTKGSQNRYMLIHNQCDAIYIHDRTGDMNFTRALIGRNEWMVDNSSSLIALYDEREGGGTARTVAYAYSKNKPVTIISPSGKLSSGCPLSRGHPPDPT